jgi:hypothetical protein
MPARDRRRPANVLIARLAAWQRHLIPSSSRYARLSASIFRVAQCCPTVSPVGTLLTSDGVFGRFFSRVRSARKLGSDGR